MSRQSFITNVNPRTLVLGEGIYFDDVYETIGQLTYGFARNPEQLAGKTAAASTGWGTSGNEARVDEITISTTLATHYRFVVFIDADVQTIRCAAHANPITAHEVEVTFTVGASGDVLVLDNAAPQGFITLDVSSTGSGVVYCEIATQLSVGSTSCDLIAWSISADAIDDGDLPAPTI